MCLIVDANRAHVLFGQPDSEDAVPIWEWLKKDGILVYGGHLALELSRHDQARRLLVELGRAGRAIREDDEAVREDESRVHAMEECTSNDQHVIALARVSGARVLYTEDQALMNDFGNPRLLHPKGKIYRRAKHRRLLSHRPGCRGRKARAR
jgi:hypothetical protein